MSDTDRMYELLQQQGSVHTHDLRREGFSGNPSQRATDIEKKFGVRILRETEFRNGRNGKRFKLDATSDGTSLAVGVNTAEGGDPSTLPFTGDTPSASLFKKRPGNAFTDPEWA